MRKNRTKHNQRSQRRRRLLLEQLEDRRMLTVETDTRITMVFLEDRLGDGLREIADGVTDDIDTSTDVVATLPGGTWCNKHPEYVEDEDNIGNTESPCLDNPRHPFEFTGVGRIDFDESAFLQYDICAKYGTICDANYFKRIPELAPGWEYTTNTYQAGTLTVVRQNSETGVTDTSVRRGIPGSTTSARDVCVGQPGCIASSYIGEITTYRVFERPNISGQIFLDNNANGLRDKDEVNAGAGHYVFVDVDDNDQTNSYDYNRDIRYNSNGTPYTGIGDTVKGVEKSAESGEDGLFTLRSVSPAKPDEDITIKSKRDGFLQTTVSRQLVPISGQDRDDIEIGVFELATAKGVVFFDENANGIQDAGEEPYSGAYVYFDLNGDEMLSENGECRGDGSEPCTVTDSDGKFVLSGGTPGSVLRVFKNFESSIITRAEDYIVTKSGQKMDAQLGVFLPPPIRGVTFEDTNLNRQFDETDKSIKDVPVILDLNNDGTVDRITHSIIDGFGLYNFFAIPPGTHSVRLSLSDPLDLVVPDTSRGYVFTVDGSQLPPHLDLGFKPGSEFVEPTIDSSGDSCSNPLDGAEGEDPFQTCENPDQELIKRKIGLYHFTLDQIDAFELTHPDEASELRKFAVGIAKVKDGVPTASLDNLTKLDKIIDQRLRANADYGNEFVLELEKQFATFKDGVFEDVARLRYVKEQFEKQAEKLWDADKQAIVDSINAGIDGFIDTTLQELDLLIDDLDKSHDGILYEMTAKALKETDFKRLAVETLGLLEIERGMDPNITFDRRLVHMFSGIFAVVDSVTLAGDLKDGAGYLASSTMRKANEHLRKQARKVAQNPELASKYAQFASDVFESMLKRKKNGQPVALDYLADGEIIPASMVREIGWTDEAIADLQRIAKECDCDLSFRTTNVDSAHHLKENGAVTKPLDVKQKTIGEYDEALGFDASDRGLVGMKSADEMIHPSKAAPCLPPADVAKCEQLKSRYAKRVDEYNEHIKNYTLVDPETGTYRHNDFDAAENAKPYVFKDGKIYDASDPNDLRPIAGDIDPVSFVDRKTGKEIVGARNAELVETFKLSDAQGQHGASQHIVSDTKKDLDARGISPDSQQYKEEMDKAFKTRLDLQKNHTNLSETTITVSPTELRMNRRFQENGFLDIDEFGNVINPLLGADVRRALRLTGIGVREALVRGGPQEVHRLLEGLNKANRERIDRLAEALGESAFFSADEFEEMSSDDFQTLCDSEPNGIILQDASGLLTVQEILDLYFGDTQPQDGAEGEGSGGGGGLTVTPIEGGFQVMSAVARERFLDNSGDGVVSPLDALRTINFLNENGPQTLPTFASLDEVRQDANVDGSISPIDVLLIINFLIDKMTPSQNSSAQTEGESTFVPPGELHGITSSWSSPATSRSVASHSANDVSSLELLQPSVTNEDPFRNSEPIEAASLSLNITSSDDEPQPGDFWLEDTHSDDTLDLLAADWHSL